MQILSVVSLQKYWRDLLPLVEYSCLLSPMESVRCLGLYQFPAPSRLDQTVGVDLAMPVVVAKRFPKLRHLPVIFFLVDGYCHCIQKILNISPCELQSYT